MRKDGKFSDWTLINTFRHMFSDAATEKEHCQIGDGVVRSRGRGPPHVAPPAPSGVGGVIKDRMQGVKESKKAERGRKWSKKAEESEECQVKEHAQCALSDPTVLRSISNILDGGTGADGGAGAF